jgi:outer membrane protein TolC
MKNLAFICLLFYNLSWAQSNVVVPRVLTWQECMDLARQKNPDLQAAEASLRATQNLETVSSSKFYPQISASVARNESNNSSFSNSSESNTQYLAQLSFSQNIFSGFSDLSRTQQARANTQVAQASLVLAKAKLSSDLKQAYQALVYAQDSMKLSQEILRRRQENLRMVDLRFQSGRENKGSLLLSKAYFQQAQFDLTQATHESEIAQEQLSSLLGLEHGSEVSVSRAPSQGLPLNDPPLAPPAFEQLVLKTPDFVQLQAQEVSSKEDIDISKSAFFPSLDLTGNYGKVDFSFFPNNEKWNTALTLTIPLFNGGRDWGTTRNAAEKWSVASIKLTGARQQLRVKLQNAFKDYVEAVEKEKVDDSFRKAQEVRADIARNKYNNGLMTFEDWDVVENDLIARQKSSLTTHRDRVANEAAWEQAQGAGVFQ